MKVVSLNMAGRSNFGGDFDARMNEITKFLDREQADVVCLQEVTFYGGESIAERCNKQMDKPYPFVLAQMSEHYTFDRFTKKFREKWDAGLIAHEGDYVTDGMAVLSKEPTVSSSSIIMKPAPADERGKPDVRVRLTQIIKLKSGMSFANVHFATNNNAYVQLQELLEYTMPDVIVGDFNVFTWDMKKFDGLWKSNYQESTDFRDYISFPEENVTFDHMLLKTGYRFESIEKFDGVSDHSAMIFTISEVG